jgi:hypothetical protein
MSRSEYVRAALAATAIWAAFFAAVGLGDNRPSLLDRSDMARSAKAPAAPAALAPIVEARAAR